MQGTSGREVEKTGGFPAGYLALGAVVFALLAWTLAGWGRLYVLRQTNQALETELFSRREQLRQLEAEAAREPSLEQRAAELGLVDPDPEDTVILHLRRENTDTETYRTMERIDLEGD